MGVWVGSRFVDMAHLPHVLFAIVAASLAGALWGAIAGFLKATVGAHEVITTIMLNWIAYWAGSYLLGRDGPAAEPRRQGDPDLRRHRRRREAARDLGKPAACRRCTPASSSPSAALFVFYLILNRTTLGYEVRAVGLQPRGGALRRHQRRAGTSSSPWRSRGSSPASPARIDILGWQFRLGVLDVQVSNIGFIGIAVALLGRNTAVGVGLGRASVRRLLTGTSTRSLDPRDLPARAGREPRADDPGADPALRRRGPADPLRLAGAAEAAAARAAAHGCEGDA